MIAELHLPRVPGQASPRAPASPRCRAARTRSSGRRSGSRPRAAWTAASAPRRGTRDSDRGRTSSGAATPLIFASGSRNQPGNMCGSTSVPSVPIQTDPVFGMRSPTSASTDSAGTLDAVVPPEVQRRACRPLRAGEDVVHASAQRPVVAVRRRAVRRDGRRRRETECAVRRGEDVTAHVTERAGAEAEPLPPLGRVVHASLEGTLFARRRASRPSRASAAPDRSPPG